MLKQYALILAATLALSACASSDTPRVIQTTSSTSEIRLTPGLATQIELPESVRVQAVIVGTPSLVSAEQSGNIVNLIPKEGTGETNILVRAQDEDGHSKLYQYRITVQAR